MPDKLADFEPLLVGRQLTSPWKQVADDELEYVPDYDLLVGLLAVPLSKTVKQASGRLAKAVDAWAAQELRRAGFSDDEVWPRITTPRVLTPELALLLAKASKKVRGDVEALIARTPGLRPVESSVLGRVFTKQADVLIARYERGPELLISTKTMLSSYGKNLRNRFEEAYGDAKNLRGRFPLLALGFLFLVRDNIPTGDLRFAQDMLRKLADEDDGYNFASLIVIGWDGPQIEDDDEDVDDDEGEEQGLDEATEAETTNEPTHDPKVRIRFDLMEDDLGPDLLCGGLVERVLDHTPIDHHEGVREKYGNESLPIQEGEYSE